MKSSNLPKPIIIMSILMAIYQIGWGITMPFFPLYLKEILKTYTNVGIVTALVSLFGIFWAIPLGELIDRISRKHLIRITLLAYIPFSFIFLSIKTLLGFIFFRLYHSFIATALWLSASAYVRSHSPKKKTAESMGFFDSVSNSALFIGPIIGGLLFSLYNYKIFYAISIFAFITFLISLHLKYKERNSILDGIKYVIKKDKIIERVFTDYLKNKKILNLSIFLLIVTIPVSFIGMLLPLFLKDMGASYFQIGVIYAFFSLPLIFESFFSATKNKRIGVLISLLIGSILFLSIFLTTNLTVIFISSIILGLCFSFINPILQGRLTDAMPKKEIGELSGVIHATSLLGYTIGPLLAGFISDLYGISIIFLLASILTFMLFVLTLKKKFVFNIS